MSCMPNLVIILYRVCQFRLNLFVCMSVLGCGFAVSPAGAGRVPNVPHTIVTIWRRAAWAPFLPPGRHIGPQYVDTCKM